MVMIIMKNDQCVLIKFYFNGFTPKCNRTIHFFLGVSIRHEKKILFYYILYI